MAERFITNPKTLLTADILNSLDRGGNVFQSSVRGLKIDVSACYYYDQTSVGLQTYAGATQQAVVGSTTNYAYLSDAGVLTINQTGFPTAKTHIPLAVVVTSANNITGITDMRPVMSLQRGAYIMADPATGNALPVAGWMRAIFPLTIAGTAETGTVADADHVDQEMVLCVESIGAGSREYTFASAIHATTTGLKWKATGLRNYATFRADKNKKWVMTSNFGGTLG